MSEAITIVTRHYAPEPTGSAPFMTDFAEWLATAGHSVNVVTVRPGYPVGMAFPGFEAGERDESVENGVAVRRLPTMVPRRGGLLGRVIPESAFFFRLLAGRLRGSYAPSPRVASLSPSIFAVAGALVLKARGGRHMAIVHDIQSGLAGALMRGGSLLAFFAGRLESAILNRVDHIVVLSDSMADHMRALGVRTPISVLPTPIDTKAIFPLERLDTTPPTLMYSGNLGHKQGLEQILAMAPLIAARAPQVRILIRGQGSREAALKAEAQRLGLGNVRFEGLVQQSDLNQSLSEGDVHLVPQHEAGTNFAVPSKIYTIMAAGRPSILTARPDSAPWRLMEATNACLCVPPNDPEAFASAALELLGDAGRRQAMGVAGRAYVCKNVDRDVVYPAMASILTSAG
ncbi:MAG: glycosyltransferase family 4 protein [Alphaproteobacteria bacterium]